LSYVSIWKPVVEQIEEVAKNSRTEVIGLLLGRMENDTIIIDGLTTAEFGSKRNHVVLPSSSLARIADDILKRRIRGNIVGWYHSHIEGGVFLSETDVETQRELQQFSSFVTAMVVDARTGDVGYFRVDPQTGKPVRLVGDQVRAYESPEDAVQPVARKEARISHALQVAPIPPSTGRRLPISSAVLAIVLVALVASAGLIGVILYQGSTSESIPQIIHKPVDRAIIGTPVQILANVTGSVRNVTLYYSSVGDASFTRTEMYLDGSGTYASLIPGEQVKGTMEYYIEALSSAGHSARTQRYQILVSDYALVTENQAFTVYRNRSATIDLRLLPINGFEEEVQLRTTNVPEGLEIGFTPVQLSFGTFKTTMHATAGPDMPTGTFTILVAAIYKPAEASPVTREATVTVTVTDFELLVSPEANEASRGSSISYTVTITIQEGFTDPVMISVYGLPKDASYQLIMSGTSIISGPGTRTITLEVSTKSTVKPGIYALMVMASGGGLTHSQTVQLIVR